MRVTLSPYLSLLPSSYLDVLRVPEGVLSSVLVGLRCCWYRYERLEATGSDEGLIHGVCEVVNT